MTQVDVGHLLILHVDEDVVGGELGAVEHVLLGGHVVAVRGLAVLVDGILELGRRDLADVEVAGLELAIGGLHVLLDGEVDAVDLGGLAVVVVKANEVDFLAIDPGAVHLEGAVADRGTEEGVKVVAGLDRSGLRHGSERGVRADEREVGVSGGELHHEGVVIRAGDAGELGGAAVEHRVVAVHQREVVGDLGRLVAGLGVADALPGVLEAGGGHRVAVVERGTLDQVEGELVRGVVDIPGLGGQAHELVGVEVIDGQRVKELIADLHALVFLGVVRVDGDRVVDVVVEGGTRGTLAGAARVVLARSERGERGRGKTALDEGTTRDTTDLLLSHTFFLLLLSRRASFLPRPSAEPEIRVIPSLTAAYFTLKECLRAHTPAS